MDFGFDKKLNIFKKICKREKFDQNEVSNIISYAKYVQSIRNKVAHWEPIVPNPQNVNIKLKKRGSYTTKNDILELNDKLFERINKENRLAIDGIIKLYIKYCKFGTIDERSDD